MTAPATYHPRRGSLSMRLLQHLQRTGQPATRAELRAAVGCGAITSHLDAAVAAGLLRIEGQPFRYCPTPALAAAALDGKRPPTVWTPERDAIVRSAYPTAVSTPSLARRLGVSVEALIHHAIQLGVRKTPAVKARIAKNKRRRSAAYITTSQRTERVLGLMRAGIADGATSAAIGRIIGVGGSVVSSTLRQAIRRGTVERRPINQRHFTYHLVRARDPRADEDGAPLQIRRPAAAAPRVITAAPRSVFDLGRAIHHHATTAP